MVLSEKEMQECIEESIRIVTTTLGKNLGELYITSTQHILSILEKILHCEIEEFTCIFLVERSEIEHKKEELNNWKEKLKKNGISLDFSCKLSEDDFILDGKETLEVKVWLGKPYEYEYLLNHFPNILHPDFIQVAEMCLEKRMIDPLSKRFITLIYDGVGTYENFSHFIRNYLRKGRCVNESLDMRKLPAGIEGYFLFLDKFLTYESWLGKNVFSVIRSIGIHELLHREEKLEKVLKNYGLPPSLLSPINLNRKTEVTTELGTILILHLNKMYEDINILRKCRELEYLYTLEPRKTYVGYYLEAHEFYEKNPHLF